jgi:Uma2 family endonuclease
MSTILSQPGPAGSPEQPGPAQGEQRFLLRDMTWHNYVALGDALLDRPGLRLTYDRGRLELMTTSPKHEIYKKWLSRFIDILAETYNLPKVSAGNMTFRKEELERGLEADDCFWITHEPQMRGKLTWDPQHDPPPDLALEIEISRSALNRLGIYASLQVPEVWCFDGSGLQVLRLQRAGMYQAAEQSLFFGPLPVGELLRFLRMTETADDLTIVRQFRTWLQQVMGKGG